MFKIGGVMDLDTAKGERVVFTGKNGYDYDREHAAEYLRVGESYSVDEIKINSSSSRVRLTEFPQFTFNTVMFQNETDTFQTTKKWEDEFLVNYGGRRN